MSLQELELRRRRRRREGEEVSNNGGELERRMNSLSLEGAEQQQQQPGHLFRFRSEEEYLIVRTSLRWLSSKRKHRNGRDRATAGKKKGNPQTIIMKKPKKKTGEGIF
jgi:hypothetical protein